MAYYVHDLSPFLIEFGNGAGIRWYGVAYVLAFYFGYLLMRWLAIRRYSAIRPEQVGDFITGCAVFGVLIGGRLGYFLFYRPDLLAADPLVFFKLWEGGMASHGGILGVMAFTLWYAWRHKLEWLNIGDNIVVVTPIGLFLGRLANFINGELYGRVAAVPWAVQFPKELYDAPVETQRLATLEAMRIDPRWNHVEAVVEGARTSPELRESLAGLLAPRHPSQLYEAFAEGVVPFALLWLLRTRCRLPDGVLTGVFFILYAVNRIIVEYFREPDASLILGFSRGQFLSFFLILIGAAFLAGAHARRTYAPRFVAAKPSAR